MTVREGITGRRSIRKFQDTPVSRDVLEQIVAAAAYAPSWKNTQVTRYIAIEGTLKDQIAARCTDAYPANGSYMADAPMVIAVTVLKNRSGYERDGSFSTPKKDKWQIYDAGIATEAFCLAAHELGLGTVILGIFDEEKAAALLDLPQDRELVTLIPIGYPAEEPVAPRRKAVEDLLSYQ